MNIYIDFDLKVVTGNRGQAFATIKMARKRGDGTEYVDLATGTSGLLSDVSSQELLQRAAKNAMEELEGSAKYARDHLTGMGLLP